MKDYFWLAVYMALMLFTTILSTLLIPIKAIFSGIKHIILWLRDGLVLLVMLAVHRISKLF